MSDGKGNWTLAISKDFDPGSYDVVVETADGMGRKSLDQTKFEINIKAPPEPEPVATAIPAPLQIVPTIAVFSGEQSPTTITGTWDEAHAKELNVSIPGANLATKLGADAALTSVQGVWTLSLAQPLPPGVYNVIVETIDAAGKAATDQTTAEIYIKAPPPPPPPAPLPPYDCAGVLARISDVFPMRFQFDHTDLKSPYDLALNQYVALLKDPRCVSEKVEIRGYTDFYGPLYHNKALSEARAQDVLKALVAAGLDAARLSTKGLSESEPLDPRRSIDARKKNRRVEITLVK